MSAKSQVLEGEKKKVRFDRSICKAEPGYSKICSNLDVTVREKSGSAGGDEERWSWEKAQVSHTLSSRCW